MPFIDYPPRNRAGKLLQLPPLEFTTPSTTPPSNSRNFIDYPPSKSGRKTPSTTPPSNSRNFIDYPPSNFHPDAPGRGSFSHTFLFRKQTLASATTAKDLGKLFFIPSYATDVNPTVLLLLLDATVKEMSMKEFEGTNLSIFVYTVVESIDLSRAVKTFVSIVKIAVHDRRL